MENPWIGAWLEHRYPEMLDSLLYLVVVALCHKPAWESNNDLTASFGCFAVPGFSQGDDFSLWK